jgi:cytidylate kinase
MAAGLVVFVIAVDGPAGSGKSSVSRAAASLLGFGYLDTGAGYRAFTYHAMQLPGVELDELIESFDYEISLNPAEQFVLLGGEDITEAIRESYVASEVSTYAREPKVRALQLEDARQRIAGSELPGVVVEGRDITTVVFPDAELRVLLTASEAVRLSRRGLEQTESSENLKARDQSDSQVVDFFTPAPGVILLDTTELDFDQSVSALADLHREVTK